jgi:hypothetical protein
MQAFTDPESRNTQSCFLAQKFLHGIQIEDSLTGFALAMMGVDIRDPIAEMLTHKIEG